MSPSIKAVPPYAEPSVVTKEMKWRKAINRDLIKFQTGFLKKKFKKKVDSDLKGFILAAVLKLVLFLAWTSQVLGAAAALMAPHTNIHAHAICNCSLMYVQTSGTHVQYAVGKHNRGNACRPTVNKLAFYFLIFLFSFWFYECSVTQMHRGEPVINVYNI